MKVLLLALLSFSLLANEKGREIATKSVSNEELNRRIEILADEINQLKAYQMYVNKNESVFGLGRSASKVYHIPQGLSIGGYGEITYIHSRAENEAGDAVSSDPTSEVLRNILYVGYKFSDKWLINMELEIEHVSQVYTEFMYVDYMHSQEVNFRAGLLLHPVGFINELHEPTLYPGVLRPRVETVIIPTTWRNLGAGVLGTVGNTTYKAYAMNGMNAQGFSTSSNRGARKRGGHYNEGSAAERSEAKEDNFRTSTTAIAFRVDQQINSNLMIGTSGFVGQASGDNENLDQRMLSLHTEYKTGAHQLRGLYVNNTFGNTDDWNEAVDNNGAANNLVNESQTGAYVEYIYSILTTSGARWTPFVRYEMLNLQASRAEAVAQNDALDSQHLTVGLNYFPLDRLVFKMDYTNNTNAAETGVDQFMLGMGYNF